jgi:F-type H+-transporting ATPase subunit h
VNQQPSTSQNCSLSLILSRNPLACIANPLRLADIVQELYLRELKAYKPTPVKDSDAAGHVATFSLPKAPKSPEEVDLASSLKEYENMAVEVEGQDASAQAPGAAAPVLEDWLVDEEEDEDAHAAH